MRRLHIIGGGSGKTFCGDWRRPNYKSHFLPPPLACRRAARAYACSIAVAALVDDDYRRRHFEADATAALALNVAAGLCARARAQH